MDIQLILIVYTGDAYSTSSALQPALQLAIDAKLVYIKQAVATQIA